MAKKSNFTSYAAEKAWEEQYKKTKDEPQKGTKSNFTSYAALQAWNDQVNKPQETNPYQEAVNRYAKVNTTTYGSLDTKKSSDNSRVNNSKFSSHVTMPTPQSYKAYLANKTEEKPEMKPYEGNLPKYEAKGGLKKEETNEYFRKQAIKEEYESIPDRNLAERYANWFTRANTGAGELLDYPDYGEEYRRKQALAPEYNKIRQEEAYKSLLDMGMTADELEALGHNGLTNAEIAQLDAEGYSEEDILKIADDVVAKNDAARNKLYNLTAGKGKKAPGELTFDDYMDLLESYEIPQLAEDTREHRIGNNLTSHLTIIPETIMNGLNNTYNYLSGKPLEHYDSAYETIRSTTDEEIEKIENPILRAIAREVYGQQMSVGDNLVAQGIGMAIGGGGGKLANSAIQGFEKADAVMNEAIDKGLSPNRIFLQGLASGVTTAISESKSMANLLKIADNGLTKFEAKTILKNMFFQGLEEGKQEISEEILDWMADVLIAGGKNDFKTRYDDYISQGYTKASAAGHVILDKTLDLVRSGFGGLLMGFGGGVNASVYGYLQNNGSNPSVQTDIVDQKSTPNAYKSLTEAVKNIKIEEVSEEDKERVEKAAELANKPENEVTKEDIVDMANVVQEQGNIEDIQKINYQANYENNRRQLRETGQIEQRTDENQIERAARQDVERREVGQYKRDVKNINSFAENNFDEATAKNFVENYKGQDTSQYAYVSSLAYNAGQTGQSFDTFIKNSRTAQFFIANGVVSESYLKTIFYNGQNAVAEGNGPVVLQKNENIGKVTGIKTELNPLQEAFGKKLGAEVHNIAYNPNNGKESKVRGNLEVALSRFNFSDTSDNVYQTMIHEAFEYAAAYNPEGMEKAYKTIVDMIARKRGEESFMQAVQAYRDAYRKAAEDPDAPKDLKAEANKTIAEAKDEFVNDAISYFFSTDEGVKTFVEYIMSDENISEEEKVSTIQTIKDWIDNLINIIKDYLSGHSTRQLGYKYAESLKLQEEELKNVRSMLIGVLDEAREKHEAMLKEQTETEGETEEKVAHQIDVKAESTEDKINASMTMDQCRDMIKRAFISGDIKDYYEGEVKNADEWLEQDGAEIVALTAENDQDIYFKYLSNIEGLDEDFTVEDIIKAYQAGTLTGEKATKKETVRLDVSKAGNKSDQRFFAPKNIEDYKNLYELANQKIIKANKDDVTKARAAILLFAHNKGAAELLGITDTDLNKALRKWGNYSATARQISMRINSGASVENRWTGIENMAWLNRVSVSDSELDNICGDIRGKSSETQRAYIARTMLALDTHIDYKGLNFVFTAKPDENRDSVYGLYSNDNRTITVKPDYPNTIAHEIGHYLDSQWGRELTNGSRDNYLTALINIDRSYGSKEADTWVQNFKNFIDDIENSSTFNNAYQMERQEVFARFVARFVIWADKIANGQSAFTEDHFNDKFTQAQFVEFARLLQEKSALNMTLEDKVAHSIFVPFEAADNIKEAFTLTEDGVLALTYPEKLTDANWRVIYKEFNKLGYGFDNVEDAKERWTWLANNSKEYGREIGITFREDQGKVLKKAFNIKSEGNNADVSTENNEALYKENAKKAEKLFGTTSNFKLAGYLDINGKLLDFSEGQGYRVQDHREISQVLDLPEDADYSDGLIEFMNEGNIRLQTYGIDIAVAPNKQQKSVLRDFFNSLNGEVSVDFSRIDGSTAGSAEYKNGTSSTRILNDIADYFETGEVPGGNAVRYSIDVNIDEELAFWGEVKYNDYIGVQKLVKQKLKNADFLQKPEDKQIYNVNSGKTIYFRINDLNETFGPGKNYKSIPKIYKLLKLATVRKLPEIIRNGVLRPDDANIDNHHDADLDKYDYYRTPIKINGIDAIVRFAIKKEFHDRFHVHYVDIDINEIANPDVLNLPLEESAGHQEVSQDLDNIVTDDSEKSRKSLAVHAGDLGKSEDFWQMTSGNRGTGHFGTGTYFVGDEEQINDGHYGKRPHEKVDFDNYNLFKPKNYKDAMKLHEALKFINNNFRRFDVLDTTSVHEDMQKLDDYAYDLFKGENTEEALNGLRDLYEKYGRYLSNYDRNRLGDMEDYSSEEDFLMEFSEMRDAISVGVNEAKESFRNAVRDLFEVLDLNPDTVRDTMIDVMKESSQVNPDERYQDSPSTSFMKALGYEGVDVRDIKQMDNTTYGSVIYDLKGDDLKRKQEIGTARYSIDVPFFESFEEVDNKVDLDEKDLQKLVENISDLDSKVSQKAVDDIAAQIKKQYNSKIDKKRLSNDIMSVFRYLKATANMKMDDVMFVMSEIARPVLEQVEAVDPLQEKLYKDFVDKVKNYKISLDAGQTQEVINKYGSYFNFVNAMKGKLHLTKEGTPLDNVWTEICDVSGGALSYGTNPNDQPTALADYIMSLNPTAQELKGESLESASTDLALEIFRQFYVYQSMADAAAKVKGEITKRANEAKERYKQKYNEAIKEVEREKALNIQRLSEEIDNLTSEQQEAIRRGDAVNQAYIENLRKDYAKRLDNLRAQQNEKIARVKAQYQNSWINKNIRRQTSELKNRLLREVKALQNMIAHPQEGASKHVPVNLINPTIAMLEAINLDNGGRNKAIAERLKKMAEVYESFKNDPNYSFDYDERIASDIEELQEMFARRSYADLGVTELQRVIEIVTALKTQIKNANNLILQDKLADAKAAATEAMEQVKGSRRHDNAAMNALNAYGNLHLNAYRLFRKLAGYRDGALMDIYNDLDEGSRREMQIQKDLGQIFTDVLEGQKNQKEVKKFISTKDEDLVDIGITDKNGKPIKITRAMRMSLIMHSMNSGNMRHVLGSGITIPNMYYFSKGKLDEAYAKGTNYRFVDYNEMLSAIQRNDQNKVNELTTKAQERVEELKKDLSPWEKDFLKAAEKMFHEETGKLINETSMALKGYALARVKNYFPIRTDRHFTKQEWAGLVQDASLEGMGMLKERVISSKPILLEDITNVIQRQIKNVSKYAGLAVPVRNFETIMKQTMRDQNDGQLHNLYETIDSVWGSSDTKWLQNLMKDIQGGRHEEKTFLSDLRGKFAGATLALNPSVAFSQAASFPTAGAVLGWKPLMKAVKDIGSGFITQNGIKELEEINPLLWYRSQGYATQDLADAKNAKLPAGVQKFTKWIEFMDTGTVRTLEYASMYYVDEHYKNLKKGSEEYWQKVSEIFSKVVEETQPNYSTLHRADVLRNPNSLLKVLLMFKTQALQNFGIVYDAIGEFNAATQSGDKQWKKEATNHLANAVSSQATALIMFSGIKILAQLMYHRPWKFRDEDDKWSWEKFLKLFGWQMGSTISGSFLIGSEIFDLIKAIATKERYYGVDVSTMSMITDVGNTIYNLSQKADKLKDADTTAEKDKSTRDLVEEIYNMVNTLGQFAGVPVNNIKNLISSMFFYTTDIINSIENGELEISNDSDLIKFYTNADIPTQYERIYDALTSMDSEKYDKLVQELIDKEVGSGLTEEEASEKVQKNVLDNITKIMKSEYLEGNISEEEMTEYLVEEKGKTEDDAYYQMREWQTGETKYGVLKNAINTASEDFTPENRKAVIDEVKDLLAHGTDKGTISSNITTNYKAEYIELYNQGKAADLNAILRAALVAAGYSDEDAKKKLEKWLE